MENTITLNAIKLESGVYLYLVDQWKHTIVRTAKGWELQTFSPLSGEWFLQGTFKRMSDAVEKLYQVA